ncbi:MAG: TrkH family potassium uptake protein [Clostridia bacterium]|nr:TrkH family potassium uptake protein [Clostridia bacterium]
MNKRMIAYVQGLLMVCEAGLLLLPLITALIYGESTVSAFIFTICLLCVVGLVLIKFKPKDKTIYARDGLVIVALGWIILSLFGALPYYISGEIPRFIDALFETVSGLTTTGASILSEVESMSKSLLFWRNFTNWIGGMGVLVFVMAVLPLSGGGGDLHLMKAEAPGPSVGKLVPKSNKTARILYLIYFALTAACAIFLLIGGLPLFDSITTAFGTAGTGGFSIYNDSFGSASPYCRTVIAVFMALFGINFNIYFLLLIKRFKDAFKSEELWTYIGIIIASVTVITINISNQFSSIGEAFHHASFQVSSLMTSTGFSSTDFNQWPELSRTILIMMMCVGACAGSTGGGFKVSRLILLVKYAAKELRSVSHPRSVKVLKFEGRRVKDETIRGTTAYFIVYVAIFCLSLILISFDKGDTTTNITSVISLLNNMGPNMGDRIVDSASGIISGGPLTNFGPFSNLSKIVFILDMLFGRLEFFPLIVLLTPSRSLRQKLSNRKRL